jgi:hypothetical protein
MIYGVLAIFYLLFVRFDSVVKEKAQYALLAFAYPFTSKICAINSSLFAGNLRGYLQQTVKNTLG